MKDFFRQDSVLVGLVVSVGSELLTALLLWVVLAVVGIETAAHLRWFAAIFVAPVLLLRVYAKRQEQPLVTKTIATVLFVTFIIYMVFLFKTGAMVL